VKLKLLLRTLHLWLGLALCVWTIAVAASGATLAFRARVEALLAPDAYFVPGKTRSMRAAPTPNTADFDRMVRELATRYPERRIVQFHRNGLDPAEAMRVNLSRRITSEEPLDVFDADLEVFVDPVTGAVLGEKPYWDVMRMIYDFHTALLSPLRGKPYLGVLGAGLFFIAVSGLIYWWPRANRFRQALRITTDRGPRRLLRDLHVFGGAAIALFLVVSTLSGVLMCYEGSIQAALRRAGFAVSTSPPPAAAAAASNTTFIPIAQAAAAALRAYPDYDIVILTPPSGGRARYSLQLFPRHASRVWRTVELQIDAASGRILSAYDPPRQPWGNNLVLWLIFLHNGQMFGFVGQAVVMVMGIVMFGLSVTGPWVWLLGRRRAGGTPAGNQRTTNRFIPWFRRAG
jgi:uncharacterized iron-regulated membrane protein